MKQYRARVTRRNSVKNNVPFPPVALPLLPSCRRARPLDLPSLGSRHILQERAPVENLISQPRRLGRFRGEAAARRGVPAGSAGLQFTEQHRR